MSWFSKDEEEVKDIDAGVEVLEERNRANLKLMWWTFILWLCPLLVLAVAPITHRMSYVLIVMSITSIVACFMVALDVKYRRFLILYKRDKENNKEEVKKDE